LERKADSGGRQDVGDLRTGTAPVPERREEVRRLVVAPVQHVERLASVRRFASDERTTLPTLERTLRARTVDDDTGSVSVAEELVGLLDDAGGLFNIVGDQLQVAGPIDYETNPDPGKSYDVVVQVTDSAGNQYGQTFTIKIGDATEITGADGYLAGATIFSDTNNNLFHDVNEVSATSDQYGNFTFTPGSGNIVLSNGFDIAKGTFFNSVLVAPSDATVISPLTTLVAAYIATHGGTEADANTAVVAALGLDSGLDLPNYDPILAALSSDGPTAANGAAAVRAAIMVQDTINRATAGLFGAGAASREVAGFAVAKAIANSFGSGPSMRRPNSCQACWKLANSLVLTVTGSPRSRTRPPSIAASANRACVPPTSAAAIRRIASPLAAAANGEAAVPPEARRRSSRPARRRTAPARCGWLPHYPSPRSQDRRSASEATAQAP